MNLSAVINRIQALHNSRENWYLKTGELLKLLAADTARFYGTLYNIKNKLNYTEALDGFTQDSMGDLVTFMEALTQDGTEIIFYNVEHAFTEAGLFLPHTRRVELTEMLINTVLAAIASHNINYTEAELMLRYKGGIRVAYQLYISTYFSFPAIIEKTVLDFCGQAAAACYLRQTAAHYLKSLFQRHILDWEKLFFSVYTKMEYYFNSANCREEADEYLVKALHILGLNRKSWGLKNLKERYRELMKIYHPDLNPTGLEEAKKINNAYTILLASLK